MKLGLHQMNVHIIRHATQAFANVIKAEGEEAMKRAYPSALTAATTASFLLMRLHALWPQTASMCAFLTLCVRLLS